MKTIDFIIKIMLLVAIGISFLIKNYDVCTILTLLYIISLLQEIRDNQ